MSWWHMCIHDACDKYWVCGRGNIVCHHRIQFIDSINSFKKLRVHILVMFCLFIHDKRDRGYIVYIS